MFGNKRKSQQKDDLVDTPPTASYLTEYSHTETESIAPEPTANQDSIEPSILSAGVVLKGNLDSPGPVHAQGTIEGEITAPRLTLGVSGEMTGKLICKHLVIDGSFNGELVCGDAKVGSSARIDGIVVCKTIAVAPGAIIIGNVTVGA